MVLLDNLFSKKSAPKNVPAQDAGPTNLPPDDEQALDRKVLRLERRELLYAIVRESMARVGVLSSSYKYKVLSLDSRGKQYLIMMDLPKEMAEHIGQLAEIEAVVTQNARLRHKIDVTAVYWRIHDLAKVATPVLRKPRAESEFVPAPAAQRLPVEAEVRADAPSKPAQRAHRFEPIRPDEVQAFKQGQPVSGKAHTSGAPSEFPATEFPSTEFEETRLDGTEDRMPLSRTQYGDLI